MPLKHLHSAKVHISVPHLATFTHTHINSTVNLSLEPCPARPTSCHPLPTAGRLKHTWKRAVDVSRSIPQILPLWECLMCGSTRSNLLTPHLNTETLLLLLGPNVSLSSNVCVHECLWVYAHLLFCVYAYIIRRMFHMSTNRGLPWQWTFPAQYIWNPMMDLMARGEPPFSLFKKTLVHSCTSIGWHVVLGLK